jgi:hypothetical protein
MSQREDILSVVQEDGPVLPAQVRRKVDGTTITIGAILSDLANKDKINISNTKVGGSPVYYTDEQREQLVELREYLNDKEQKAMDRLQEQHVLRDSEQEPVIRAALREIKDFAHGYEVTVDDETEVFWTWYLTSEEEAEDQIRSILDDETVDDTTEEASSEEEKASEERTDDHGPTTDDDSEDDVPLENTDDDFVNNVRAYFDERDIDVREENIVRKGSDVEYTISVPTALGPKEFYCKAKNKKKCNDGDLSSAYLKGQSKKLPVVFLYTGEVTQKAKGKLDTEFKGLLLKQL